MSKYKTFADLQAATSRTNQRNFCIERDNAEYITQNVLVIAQPGDVIYANGLTGQLQIRGEANVRKFGALGSSSTPSANAAGINDALKRHMPTHGTIYAPADIYEVNASIILPTVNANDLGFKLKGDGADKTIIRMADNANIHLMVDERWDTNNAFASGRIQLEGFTLDGNKANNTAGHLLICKPFFMNSRNVWWIDGPQKGVVFTAKNKDLSASSIGGDNFFGDYCKITGCREHGFYGDDNGQNKLADVWFENMILSNNGSNGFPQLESTRSTGFVFDNVRCFFGHSDDIVLHKAGGNILDGVHLDVEGQIGGVNNYAGLVIKSFSSSNASVTLNCVISESRRCGRKHK
jgi:hypothetical protein